MTKLNPAQEMHLRNVKSAAVAYKNAKVGAIARAKIAADEEVENYRARMDYEVRLAFDAGVPKKQIREIGLGTSAPITLVESLSRTVTVGGSVGVKETDPHASRYSWERVRGSLTVTLDGAELDAAADAQDWTAPDAIAAGVDRAEFTVNIRADRSRYVSALTDDYLPEHERRHPVVAWAQAPENEAEMLAWFALTPRAVA